jgi:hypothetical protein
VSASKVFDIPPYYYFKSRNDYIGSLHGMNFRIASGDRLTVYLYYGTKSFELSEPYSQNDFDNTSEGYSKLITWLEDEYARHKLSPHYVDRIRLL